MTWGSGSGFAKIHNGETPTRHFTRSRTLPEGRSLGGYFQSSEHSWLDHHELWINNRLLASCKMRGNHRSIAVRYVWRPLLLQQVHLACLFPLQA